MKAGYGEPLRKLFGESAWVESVVDLGHNKEVFPDADVFPCILIARKPDARPAPKTARVCVLPAGADPGSTTCRADRGRRGGVPRAGSGPSRGTLNRPAWRS